MIFRKLIVVLKLQNKETYYLVQNKLILYYLSIFTTDTEGTGLISQTLILYINDNIYARKTLLMHHYYQPQV